MNSREYLYLTKETHLKVIGNAVVQQANYPLFWENRYLRLQKRVRLDCLWEIFPPDEAFILLNLAQILKIAVLTQL